MRRLYAPDLAALAPAPDFSTPRKIPAGGRPNPIAAHRVTEKKPIVLRKQTIPQSQREVHRRTLCQEFCAAVRAGELPIGVLLTGQQLRARLGKNFHGGWENVAANLAADQHPYRLRTVGTGRRPRYRIDPAA